ncbi:hypothetical protein MNBD_NITROSPINAE01-901 [hydrothermal vent metagenome]|uniref:Uncharacterized protein n=1 Tax=hydrothermal vent metagenome TaxID=652676 RepID=A0A3B1BUD7_9ZZZZ
MFTLIRKYVKTSLMFFAIGLVLGLVILILQVSGNSGGTAKLISVHTHLTLFGFIIMLIMAVAYWMFPRPTKDDIRYSPHLAEINYWLITCGTAIRSFAELVSIFAPSMLLNLAVVLGALLQLASGFLFIWNIWSRIRAVGSQIREARGEKF